MAKAHPEQRAEFISEARHLDRFRHTNIINLFAVAFDDKKASAYKDDQQICALVLELCRCSLHEALYNGTEHGFKEALALPTRLALLRDLGKVLYFLHNLQPHPVVHRDIKTANLLLTPTTPPVLKLIDFGHAAFQRTSKLSKSGGGTANYNSPEQAQEDVKVFFSPFFCCHHS